MLVLSLQRSSGAAAVPSCTRPPDVPPPLSCSFTPEGEYCIEYPGLVRFRFSPDSSRITALCEPGTSDAYVHELFARELTPLVIQLKGREVLHASAVLTHSGVVAFCGESGAGKSTLAYAFALCGYPLVADDALVIDSTSPIRIAPLPFAIRLRPDAASFFGSSPEAPVNSQGCQQDPLRALVLLEREPDAAVPRVTRLRAADAFRSLLPHAYCLSLHDLERKRRMVSSYLDLAERVPAFQVTFAPGLERVAAVRLAIEDQLADAGRYS